MEFISRREFLRSMVGAAGVVTIASTGVTLLPNVTEAAPVPADKSLPKAMEDFVENAQYRYGRRHYRRYYRRGRRHYRRGRRYYRRWYRRGRRWHCWWYRGRRVCG